MNADVFTLFPPWFGWFLEQRHKDTEAAIADLRHIYPKVPVGFPEGSENEESTYLHILVVFLEYRADIRLLGELRAREVMEFWSNDHYTWVYRTVLADRRDIARIIAAHNLSM